MKYNDLTPQESAIIEHKQTEQPFSGEYDTHFKPGTYICRKCNNPLYSAQSKFEAHCGWPAFDDCFATGVTETVDDDGLRTEITCANCGGHLGHVFRGEGFTQANTRHCVNSLSIQFISEDEEIPQTLYEKN